MHIVFIRNLRQTCASIFPSGSHFSVEGEARGWDGVGGAGVSGDRDRRVLRYPNEFLGVAKGGQQNFRALIGHNLHILTASALPSIIHSC